jgi:hypothetical protein
MGGRAESTAIGAAITVARFLHRNWLKHGEADGVLSRLII